MMNNLDDGESRDAGNGIVVILPAVASLVLVQFTLILNHGDFSRYLCRY